MITTTFTNFRQHVAEYLNKVEHGQTVLISRHGKIIAEINPVSQSKKKFSWQNKSLKLPIKGVSIAKVIIDERNKE